MAAPAALLDLLGYVGIFGRFPAALRRFVREPLRLEDAERRVREQVERRDENFLRMLQQSVYGCRTSPYLRLLNRAGIAFGDVQAWVATKGIEDTLRDLREAGVYVTFEEFKGRRPIERGGDSFAEIGRAHV